MVVVLVSRLTGTCPYQLQSGCTYTNVRLVVGRSVGSSVRRSVGRLLGRRVFGAAAAAAQSSFPTDIDK